MASIVFVVDVGTSNCGNINNLDYTVTAISIVQSLVQRKLFTDSKDLIGLVLCGSSTTSNPLNKADPENYKNIDVVRELDRINWEFVEYLNEFNVERVDSYDLFEGIIVANDHLVTKLRGRKKVTDKKQIIVLSNLNCEINWCDLETVLSSFKSENIEIDIISTRELPDFDDETEKNSNNLMDNPNNPSTSRNNENGMEMSKLTPLIKVNEKMLNEFIEGTGGISSSFQDALLDVNYFECKSVTQRGWKVDLKISNMVSININGFTKVKPNKLPPTKEVYGGDPNAEIDVNVTYHVNNDENSEIDQDDLIKGYKYGSSIVPCTEEDIDSMKLTVEKSMDLIGFTEEERIRPELYIGDGSIFFIPTSSEDEAAFVSLVHAMFEMGVVAVVRRVYNRVSMPRLGVLSPRINSDSNSVLVYRDIAFGEDIRRYPFASLPTLSQPSSSSSTSSSEFISPAEVEAVDRLIDKLMLTKETTNDDNEVSTKELYKPHKIINPAIQLFYQTIEHDQFNSSQERPTNPGKRIMSDLFRPTNTDRCTNELFADIIRQLSQVFPLKKKNTIQKKATDGECDERNSEKGRKKIAAEMFPELDNETLKKRQKLNPKEENKEQSSTGFLDISSILGDSNSSSTINYDTAIRDFDYVIGRGMVESGISAFQQIIRRSILSSDYNISIQYIRHLRQCVLRYGNEHNGLVQKFNDFCWSIKEEFNLETSHVKLWKELIDNDLGLIDQAESKYGVSADVKRRFLNILTQPMGDPADAEMENLFDDM